MLSFTSIVCPSWFIYQFNPSLFFKVDFPTKLLLAAGCGFPVILINLFFLLLYTKKFNNETEWPRIVTLASCTAALSFYLACLSAINKKLDIETGIKMVMISEVVILIMIIIAELFRDYRNRFHKSTHDKPNTPAAPADPLPPNLPDQTPSDI